MLSVASTDQKFKAKLRAYLQQFGYKDGVGFVQWQSSGSEITGIFGDRSGSRSFEFTIGSDGLSYKPVTGIRQTAFAKGLSLTSAGVKPIRKDARSQKNNCYSPTSYSCGQTCINNNKQCRVKDPRAKSIALSLIQESKLVNLGKNTPYSQVLKIVEEEEDKIANLPYEQGVIVDSKTGVVLTRARGKQTSVEFSAADVAKMRGNILTHNHPNIGGHPQSDPRWKGYSFSELDIQAACIGRVAEVRAVSSGYRHSMKPPPTGFNPGFYNNKVLPSYRKNLRSSYMEAIQAISSGRLDARLAETEVLHTTWERVAKETGMVYTRTGFGMRRDAAKQEQVQSSDLKTRALVAVKQMIETWYRGGIDRLLSATTDEKNVITGQFLDNKQIFDFTISESGNLSYVEAAPRSDSYWAGLAERLDVDQTKQRACTVGKPCGDTCIARGIKCNRKLPPQAIAALPQVREALGGASLKGNSTSRQVESRQKTEQVSSKARSGGADDSVFYEQPQFQEAIATFGVSAAGVAAILGTSMYVVQRDLEVSSVPFESIRQPPGGVPDEKTLEKYDQLKPGDLIRKNFKSDQMGTRQHYAVYVGKDPESGEHMLIDTGIDWKSRDGVPYIRKRGLNWDAGPNDSEYEKVPEEEMYLAEGTRRMSGEEVVARAEKMLYNRFTYQGFDSNCEAFARAIVEGKAYSTQGDKASGFTRAVSGVVTDSLLKLRTANDYFPGASKEDIVVEIGGYKFTGVSEYATEENKWTAKEIADFLEKDRIISLRRKAWEWLPNPYTGKTENKQTEGLNRPALPAAKTPAVDVEAMKESRRLPLKKSKNDAEVIDSDTSLINAFGMRDPKEYADLTEVIAKSVPAMGDAVRIQMYKDYFLILLTTFSKVLQTAQDDRTDSLVENQTVTLARQRLAAMLRLLLSRGYRDGADLVFDITSDGDSISGLFLDEGRVLKFTINLVSSGVRYSKATDVTQARVDSLRQLIRYDAPKKRNCTVGISCGEGCISSKKECQLSLTKLASPQEIDALKTAAKIISTDQPTESPQPEEQSAVPETKLDPLADLTIRQLRKLAADMGVYKYSYMNKEQLKSSIKTAEEDPAQQERLRKTLERAEQERNLDPVKDWKRVVKSKRAWNQKDIATAIQAGGVLLGVGLSIYNHFKDNYQGNFAVSANTAISRSRTIDVPNVGNKQFFTFTVDGFSVDNDPNNGSKLSQKLQEVAPEFMNRHHVVPIDSNDFSELAKLPVDTPGVLKAPVQVVTATSKTLSTTMLEGSNPKAIDMAAQVLAYRNKYPGKRINLVGFGSGGMVVNEAVEILHAVDKNIAKNLRVTNIATPHFGITSQRAGTGDGTGRHLTVTSGKDPLNIFPKINPVSVNTVSTHSIDAYLDDDRARSVILDGLGKNDPSLPRKPKPKPKPRKLPRRDSEAYLSAFRELVGV